MKSFQLLYKEARYWHGPTVYANIDIRDGEISYDISQPEDPFIVNLFEMKSESIGDLYADEDYLAPDDQEEYLKEEEEDEPRWYDIDEYLAYKGYDREELENALFEDSTADFELNTEHLEEMYSEIENKLSYVTFLDEFDESDLTIIIANDSKNDTTMLAAVKELTKYPYIINDISKINESYVKAGKKVELDNTTENREKFKIISNIKAMVDKAQKQLDKEHSKPVKQKSQELEK